MLKIMKKLIIKILLFTFIVALLIISKFYKIILHFFAKHKANIKKFYKLIVKTAVILKGFYTQVNLEKELEKCLINLK